jgi:hypothetical protein
MTRFKDFGTGEDIVKEPLSFKLYGEEFHCIPSVQGKLLLDMIADSTSEETGKAVDVIRKFFKRTLLDESYERFDALINDPDKIVSVETLGEISGWLVSEYTSRPTKRPQDSSSGQ